MGTLSPFPSQSISVVPFYIRKLRPSLTKIKDFYLWEAKIAAYIELTFTSDFQICIP
jgi:hypothetical protein